MASVPPNPAPASGGRGMPLWGWVVIGVGVFAFVGILAAIAIPVFLNRVGPITEAKAAIDTYDSAWVNGDCDALAEATTQAMREDWGYDDCAEFVSDAKDFDEANRNYQTTLVSADYADGRVAVVTKESYTDVDGKDYLDQVTYTVVKDGDAWKIDAIDFASDDDGHGDTTDA